MKQIVLSYLDGLRAGEAQRHENLVMVPLLSDVDDGLGYITLAEALAAGQIEIREVSEAGSVPELRVVNRASSASAPSNAALPRMCSTSPWANALRKDFSGSTRKTPSFNSAVPV